MSFNVGSSPSWVASVTTHQSQALTTGMEVKVTLDATGLSQGHYTFTLTASENAFGSPVGYTSANMQITLDVTTNALPIELTAFDAKLSTSQEVDLMWTTVSEINAALICCRAPPC